jgi:trehalose 6-phosphate phosphatase
MENDGMEHSATDPTRDAPRPPPPAPADAWALFIDVDGCLLDLAATPDAVRVPGDLQPALVALARRMQGALALVSGRSLAMLDALFPELRALPAAGLHGLERRDGNGLVLEPPPVPPALREVQGAAEAVAAAHPGAIVEAKGPNLALHWRSAPQAEADLRDVAAAALGRLPEYRVQAGDHVLELRPDNAIDKGGAIAAFLREPPFRDRQPVFLGDDLTDEHGFAVVNALGGLSVLVGRRADSAARYALPDPAAVRAWLRSDVAADAEATA